MTRHLTGILGNKLFVVAVVFGSLLWFSQPAKVEIYCLLHKLFNLIFHLDLFLDNACYVILLLLFYYFYGFYACLYVQ